MNREKHSMSATLNLSLSEKRVDLHVHSRHSGPFHLYVLKSLQVEESYTDPQVIYSRLMARGMHAVTITDHDSIAGALEIAHHGDHVFLSEEVSARYPENGCIVHVLVYGITEAQHGEIQRLRNNIYELVPYLRSNEIVHSLAHPFSPVNKRMKPELLHKSFLLFDTLELVNGQKDPGHQRFVDEVFQKVDRPLLERWANAYDIAPASWNPRWGITGGSDDHSGITLGRAWTSYRGEATGADVVRAIAERRTWADGHEKTGVSYSHTAHAGTLNYFLETHPAGEQQTLIHVLRGVHERAHDAQNECDSSQQDRAANDELDMQGVDALRSVGGQTFGRSGVVSLAEVRRQMPSTVENEGPAIGPAAMRVLDAYEKLRQGHHEPLDSAQVFERGHTKELHDRLFEQVNATLMDVFKGSFQRLQAGLFDMDPEQLIEEIPNLIRFGLFNVPYYFGLRYFSMERRRGWALYDWLDLPKPLTRPQRVAIACDTIDNVDGLGIGLRRMLQELRDDGKEVFLCSAAHENVDEDPDRGIVRFPVIASFPLIGYGSYRLGWPSLVSVMRWLDEQEIDLVQVSTPGPVGIVTMLASHIMGIPVVGQWHTNLAEYAQRIIGDRSVGSIVKAYSSWFYNCVTEVIVPTHAAGEALANHGIHEDHIQVIRRGIDTNAFDPALREPGFWRERGLAKHPVLLYVGRVSVEKGVPFLTDLFRDLIDDGKPVTLAVVGDGPWLETMKNRLQGYPVAFTGYLEGKELATAYASSDLFVFPSTTDTFGNVVLEALASGIPALVSDVGGPAEIVRHRQTGLILPARNAEAWKEAIVLLAGDAERRHALGAVSRTYATSCTFAKARTDLWSFYEGHIRRARNAYRAQPN